MGNKIIEILNQKKIDKFNLIGHSMGGMIVQEITKIIGERVNNLICFATGSIGDIPGRFETMDETREKLKKEGTKISFSRVPPKWFVKGNKDKNYFLCESAVINVSLETADNLKKTVLEFSLNVDKQDPLLIFRKAQLASREKKYLEAEKLLVDMNVIGLSNSIITKRLELLSKTLRRMKLTNEKDALLKAFSRFGFADERSLLIAIGTGVLTVREIFQKIRPKEEVEEVKENKNDDKFSGFSRARTKGIILDGIDNLLINFGKCCNPIPGDDLIGFVT